MAFFTHTPYNPPFSGERKKKKFTKEKASGPTWSWAQIAEIATPPNEYLWKFAEMGLFWLISREDKESIIFAEKVS